MVQRTHPFTVTPFTVALTLAVIAGAVLGLAVAAAPAQAHGAIAPASAPAGEATRFTLTIPHGCTPGEPPPDPGEEVAPTIDVAVRLPPAATLEDAQAPDGWNADPSSAEGREIIAWSSGRLDPDEVGIFAFTATVYGEEGEQVPFEVFQGCTEGAYRWVEVADDGDTGTPDQPAPLVRLTSTAAAPAGGSPSDGDDLLDGAPGEGDTDVDGAGAADGAGSSAQDLDETGPGDAAAEVDPDPTAGTSGAAAAGTEGDAAEQAATEQADAAAADGADGGADGGLPAAVWVLGGLVVVGAVAAGVFRLRGGADAGGGA